MRHSRLNFLIAGVQKGGTSALHHYLRRHTQICLPERKEMHFFDNDTLDWNHPRYDLYHAEFPGTPHDSQVGEATPNYVYWPPAAGRIHAYNPSIKLIISFRDPVARAYSQYRMHVVRRMHVVHEQNVLSFSDIIRDVRSHIVTGSGTDEQPGLHFSYIARGLYAAQVERLLNLFPRDQILFLTRIDLLERRKATLDGICEFLEVSRFEHYPAHKIIKSHADAFVASLLPEDIRYLRKWFHDDLERTQTLIGRVIELEV